MIPELYPELFPKGNPHLDKELFIRSADLIICISETTRRDLFRIYGGLGQPVVVIPHGVGERFRGEADRLPSLPDRYVLFVGNRGAYKDFPVLARAFARTRRDRSEWLVVVGGGEFTASEAADLQTLGILERVRHVALADAELPGAYGHALCFVSPSRYEGFGLTTLEAMASGCPTLLASTPAHREVGGDSSYFLSLIH